MGNTEERKVEKRKIYGKYGRKVGWIMKWYGKCGRTLWNDMDNMEESKLKCELIWKIWKKGKSNSDKI